MGRAILGIAGDPGARIIVDDRGGVVPAGVTSRGDAGAAMTALGLAPRLKLPGRDLKEGRDRNVRVLPGLPDLIEAAPDPGHSLREWTL